MDAEKFLSLLYDLYAEQENLLIEYEIDCFTENLCYQDTAS